MSDTAVLDQPEVKVRPAPKERPKPKVEPPTMWNVVLHDDNDHSYEYVMVMLQTLFAKSFEMSFLMAREVDSRGRVICETCHKERAEFKRDQITAFGADPLIPRCKGSMTATIEPACGDGGDGDEKDKDRSGGGAGESR